MRTLRQIMEHTAALKAAGAVPTFPQHKAKVPATPLAARRALEVFPCVYKGDLLPSRRDGSNKSWYECEHPAQPLGPSVCSCKGCGPKCKGYKPDAGEPELKSAAPLTVLPPPIEDWTTPFGGPR